MERLTLFVSAILLAAGIGFALLGLHSTGKVYCGEIADRPDSLVLLLLKDGNVVLCSSRFRIAPPTATQGPAQLQRNDLAVLGPVDTQDSVRIVLPEGLSPEVIRALKEIRRIHVTHSSVRQKGALPFPSYVVHRCGNTTYSDVEVPLALPALLFLLLGAIGTMRVVKVRRRPRLRLALGLCPMCGYDLTGNASGQCPECGCVIKNLETRIGIKKQK